LKPQLIISIELAGLSEQNYYYNMSGEDISVHCATFDYFMVLANCPTITIGVVATKLAWVMLQDLLAN
jgi:hypothetical protein